MSSLGLTHHSNVTNLRISPQTMAAMSPQNMRLASPHHPNGPIMSSQMLAHRHTPPNHMSLQPPQSLSSVPVSVATAIAPSSTTSSSSPPVNNNLQPLSSPQNLSLSPSQGNSRLSNSRIHSSNSSSPENLTNSGDKQQHKHDDNDANNEVPNKEIALNMTMNNTDMRTNSIATLRIKAKEHLESINKGLAIA